MTEESYIDKLKREHPWYWRCAVLTNKFQTAWDWLWDEPYWDFTQEPARLAGLRTGKPCKDREEES